MSSCNPGLIPIPLASVALRVRKARNQILGDELFSDPAWDILLRLRLRGPHTVSELATKVGISEQTCTRWVRLLAERELVEFNENGLIGVTEAASRQLEQIFSTAVSIGPVTS